MLSHPHSILRLVFYYSLVFQVFSCIKDPICHLVDKEMAKARSILKYNQDIDMY